LDTVTGKPLKDPVPALPTAVATGGNLWVVGEEERTLWSRRPERLLVTFDIGRVYDNRFVNFSPDGIYLAWGEGDGTVTMCDLPLIQIKLAELGLGW
jgi:hypothetical protein